MYNNDIKEKYINYERNRTKDNSSSDVFIGFLYRLFTNTESFEEVYELDLAEMDISQIQYIFTEIGGSFSYNMSLESAIKKYVKWCSNNDIFDNVIDHSKFIFLDKNNQKDDLKFKFVKSPQDLIEKCDVLFSDVETELTIRLMCRATLYLSFCGYSMDEIVNLKKGNLDYKRVYPEFVDVIEQAANTTQYQTKVSSKYLKNKYINDDYVIKAYNNRSGLKSYLCNRISNATEKYNQCSRNGFEPIQISPSKVCKSGLYYRTYQIERQKGKIDLGFNARKEYEWYKKVFCDS